MSAITFVDTYPTRAQARAVAAVLNRHQPDRIARVAETPDGWLVWAVAR